MSWGCFGRKKQSSERGGNYYRRNENLFEGSNDAEIGKRSSWKMVVGAALAAVGIVALTISLSNGKLSDLMNKAPYQLSKIGSGVVIVAGLGLFIFGTRRKLPVEQDAEGKEDREGARGAQQPTHPPADAKSANLPWSVEQLVGPAENVQNNNSQEERPEVLESEGNRPVAATLEEAKIILDAHQCLRMAKRYRKAVNGKLQKAQSKVKKLKKKKNKEEQERVEAFVTEAKEAVRLATAFDKNGVTIKQVKEQVDKAFKAKKAISEPLVRKRKQRQKKVRFSDPVESTPLSPEQFEAMLAPSDEEQKEADGAQPATSSNLSDIKDILDRCIP